MHIKSILKRIYINYKKVEKKTLRKLIVYIALIRYLKMVYVKLTTENDTHNGYQYKEGLNCLNGEFNNEKKCGPGGLYFCRKENIGKWISILNS